MRIYLTYGTTEGQTAKIADVVAEVLRSHGHEVTAVDVKDAGHAVPAGYDGVVVGASVHMGKHDKHVVDLVARNLDVLRQLPTAFFSVSLAAAGDDPEAEKYLEEFEKETGWQPGRIAMFGGALPYTHYNLVKRYMMKRIVSGKPGDLGTDVSRDYVYTEWDGVRRFAEAVAADLEGPD